MALIGCHLPTPHLYVKENIFLQRLLMIKKKIHVSMTQYLLQVITANLFGF